MSFEPIFDWRWYVNINGQWFRRVLVDIKGSAR